jgi:hypothetical protein
MNKKSRRQFLGEAIMGAAAAHLSEARQISERIRLNSPSGARFSR